MACRGRASLTRYTDRAEVNGYTEIWGDEWIWFLRINDTELTGASVKFTAKTNLEDPDAVAELALTSAASGGITVEPTSTATRLDAKILIPKTLTEAIILPDVCTDGMKTALYFDVQIVRSTPVNAPSVQTYFRREHAKFYVLKDVTNVS